MLSDIVPLVVLASSDFPEQDAFSLLQWIANPHNWAILGTIGGTIYTAARFASKRLYSRMEDYINQFESKQNEQISQLDSSLTDIKNYMIVNQAENELTMLRIQLQTGLQTGLLTQQELYKLYDEYKRKGGNSYIDRLVCDYHEKGETNEN